jgi:hypothetical protein
LLAELFSRLLRIRIPVSVSTYSFSSNNLLAAMSTTFFYA